ncbi:hypothetical protein [Blautia producta]|uniref:Uncharacterized protein n=1 Tax=Blautia producta TaxID=33035 RepID=A0ABZ0U8Y5_9FIRM|nr:hypothetical protein [Blautia coccoides]TCO52674.1 hypothetical protein EV205_14513 [Blautia coccoides]WPX73674.1 hypothetical protein BLCOC_20240 [Blautia coccoides]SUY07736.1 Uncharacterised protein [Blautia coccoides]
MNITKFTSITFAICLIALPLLYIYAFGSHPHLLNLKPTKTAKSWAAEFRHNKKLHTIHVLVLASSLLVINLAINMANLLPAEYQLFGIIGETLSIIGAVALAADKGALCLVPSAFDSLSDNDFNQSLPALQTLLDNKGYIWVVKLLILMPIGFIILSIGLSLSGVIAIWQGVTLIIGMLFMINPDIDLLSLIGSLFMLISLGSMGLSIIF